MIFTYVLDTDTLPDPSAPGMEACMEGLPQERIEKIRRIRHPGARKQSLGAGLLLKHVLDQLAPGAEIKTNPYGKPVCAGIPFSLSHTENAVILSIWSSPDPRRIDSGLPPECEDFSHEAADFLIGCDIEQVRPYKSRIARRFFTRAESESLEAVKDPQAQAELFCRYWTKKESVMKLTGLGMMLPMDLYDVRGSQALVDTEKTVKWYESGLKKEQGKTEYRQAVSIFLNKRIYLKEYRYRGRCITVCSVTDRFAPELFVVSECFLQR